VKHVSSISFQAWRTPDVIYRGANEDYGPFELDAAADLRNAKVLSFFDEEADALAPGSKWYAKRVWVNPPYADVRPWIDKAEAEVAAGHCELVALLVPAAVGVAWFTYALQTHAVELYDERIRFDLPPIEEVPEPLRAKLFKKNGKPKTSPGGGNALVIVRSKELYVAGTAGRLVLRSAKTGRMLA
jgi:phage N-6-adenine-methyltransferase